MPALQRGVLTLFLPVEADDVGRLVRVPMVDSDIDRLAFADLLGGQVHAAYRWQVRTAGRGPVPRGRGTDRGGARGYSWLYLLIDRDLRRLPLNTRAVELGHRLGNHDEAQRLLGPVLMVGAGLGGGPVDVQLSVQAAARRHGLMQWGRHAPERDHTGNDHGPPLPEAGVTDGRE